MLIIIYHLSREGFVDILLTGQCVLLFPGQDEVNVGVILYKVFIQIKESIRKKPIEGEISRCNGRGKLLITLLGLMLQILPLHIEVLSVN